MIKGFREFVLRGNVLDLAVAVVIGLAFGAVVTALVADLITPIVAAIFGKPDFGNLSFTIHKSQFKYGDFLNHLITFLSVAAAVYFVVVLPIQKLTELRARRLAAGQDADEAKPVSDEVALLSEIRDLLRSRA